MKINYENDYLNLNKTKNESNTPAYSVEQSEEMQRMQQEAIKRVHDMQNRAKRSLDAGRQYEFNSLAENNTISKKSASENVNENQANNIKDKDTNTSSTNFNILQLLTKDTEKSLILFLILLLVDEKADSNLILALLYLVL